MFLNNLKKNYLMSVFCYRNYADLDVPLEMSVQNEG